MRSLTAIHGFGIPLYGAMSAGETPRLSGQRQGSTSSQLSGSSLELQTSRSLLRPTASSKLSSRLNPTLSGLARHTLGLLLLLLVVFLWTASNFMGSVRTSGPVFYCLATDQPSEHLRGQLICQAVLFDIFQHDLFHLHSCPCLHQVRISKIPGKQLSLVYPYSYIPPTHQKPLRNVRRLSSLSQA